jgi:antitoxin FitA
MGKMVQIRNVPDALHRKLKARAAMAGMSLSEYLLREIRQVGEKPAPEELLERLRQRSVVEGSATAADIIRERRDER